MWKPVRLQGVSAVLVAGFGLSGWLPVLNTYIMSLPSMTPSLMAAFVVLVNMSIYMAGFISSLVVGWLSQSSFGLRNTLALFSWIELVAILMFMQLPTIANVDVSNIQRQAQSFDH
jgi:sugar phosphate permease